MIIKVEKSVGVTPACNWGEAKAGPEGPLVPVLLLEAEGVKIMVVFTSTDEARAFGSMACFEAVTCDLANRAGAAAAASALVRPNGAPLGPAGGRGDA